MYSKLLEQVNSKEDKERMFSELERLLESVYKTGEGCFEEVLRSRVRKKTAEVIRDSLADYQGSREDYLQGLKAELEKMQDLVLTLAFEPSEKLIEKAAEWIRENVKQSVVLDFISDPAIIGGAVVIFKGHYADFSIAKTLRGVLKESKYLNPLSRKSPASEEGEAEW